MSVCWLVGRAVCHNIIKSYSCIASIGGIINNVVVTTLFQKSSNIKTITTCFFMQITSTSYFSLTVSSTYSLTESPTHSITYVLRICRSVGPRRTCFIDRLELERLVQFARKKRLILQVKNLNPQPNKKK